MNDERAPLSDCSVVDTPFGLGVAVDDVVWTQFGPGSFPVDAREHQAKLDRLAEENPGSTICMMPFSLHPPAGHKFMVFSKKAEDHMKDLARHG